MQPDSVSAAVQNLEPEIRRRHTAELSKIARRFDADDLVQTVAVKAHTGAANCRAETVGELRRWVLTIAKRAVFTAVERELNAQKRSLKLELEVGTVADTGQRGDVLESIVEAEQFDNDMAWVNGRMAALAPRQAQAIRLRYLEQLEYSEIASRMGVTSQAVRSLVAKGLAAVRAAK